MTNNNPAPSDWHEAVAANEAFVRSLLDQAETVIVDIRALRVDDSNRANKALQERIGTLTPEQLRRALGTTLLRLAMETAGGTA